MYNLLILAHRKYFRSDEIWQEFENEWNNSFSSEKINRIYRLWNVPIRNLEFIYYTKWMQKIVFFPFNNSNFYNWVIPSKILELFSKKTSKKTNKLS